MVTEDFENLMEISLLRKTHTSTDPRVFVPIIPGGTINTPKPRKGKSPIPVYGPPAGGGKASSAVWTTGSTEEERGSFKGSSLGYSPATWPSRSTLTNLSFPHL